MHKIRTIPLASLMGRSTLEPVLLPLKLNLVTMGAAIIDVTRPLRSHLMNHHIYAYIVASAETRIPESNILSAEYTEYTLNSWPLS